MSIRDDFLLLQHNLSEALDQLGIGVELRQEYVIGGKKDYNDPNVAVLAERFQDYLQDHSYDSEWRFLLRLGNYYLIVGEEDIAVYCYQLASKINENEFSYYNQAKIYETTGDYDKAKEFYLKALRVRPQFPHALKGLAEILEKADDSSESESVWLRLLEINPRDSLANKKLGYYYYSKGNKERALMHFKRIINPSSEIMETIKKLESPRSLKDKVKRLFGKK